MLRAVWTISHAARPHALAVKGASKAQLSRSRAHADVIPKTAIMRQATAPHSLPASRVPRSPYKPPSWSMVSIQVHPEILQRQQGGGVSIDFRLFLLSLLP